MSDTGLQHLLDIESLSLQQVQAMLDLASRIADKPSAYTNLLGGRVLINLFLEPSTRTRISLEIAAKRLGMHVINFQPETSSAVKGEALIDTFHTLQAMAPDVIAVRHQDDGVVASLAADADDGVHIINAGSGCNQHPTQALLDAVTLLRSHGDFSSLTVTIAGDIRHSRVARSNISILKKLGVRAIRLAGPVDLLPDEQLEGVEVFDNLDQAVTGADVIMMLRIQRERFDESGLPDDDSYFKSWGLDRERLGLASPNCVVLHPGPLNRGVEIAPEIAESDRALIREQVRNGVYTRMAVLLTLLVNYAG